MVGQRPFVGLCRQREHPFLCPDWNTNFRERPLAGSSHLGIGSLKSDGRGPARHLEGGQLHERQDAGAVQGKPLDVRRAEELRGDLLAARRLGEVVVFGDQRRETLRADAEGELPQVIHDVVQELSANSGGVRVQNLYR